MSHPAFSAQRVHPYRQENTAAETQPTAPHAPLQAVFESGTFRLKPPAQLSRINPIADGVECTDFTTGVTAGIHHIAAVSGTTTIVEQLADPTFREGFIEGFNRLTPRKFSTTSVRFKTVAAIPVFAMSAIDPANRFKPMRSLLFVKNGREFRLTLEVPTADDLERYDYLFSNIIAALEVK